MVKSMKFSDRKRIHVLGIPLRDLVRGNEKAVMEIIAKAFINLHRIDLIAGDGEEDAQVSKSAQLLLFTPGQVITDSWYPKVDPRRGTASQNQDLE